MDTTKKILIVDDNDQDRKIMKRYLLQAGYEHIVEADSGDAALKIAQEESPSVILLDTNMPGLDGFETCKRLKSLPGVDSIVIVITGLVDAIDTSKAFEAGADEYCVKTVNCAHILETVKKL